LRKGFCLQGWERREATDYGSRGDAEARRKEEEREKDSRRGAEIAEEEK
jgi:hypothetical protein